MSKKILGLVLAASMAFAFVGCSLTSKEKKSEEAKEAVTMRSVGEDAKSKTLEGAWAEKEFTHKTFTEEGGTLSTKVKEQNDAFGLEYTEGEKIETLDGVEANVKSIYLENKDPKPNKLESMSFKTQFLGASQEGGKFELKMSLKFDGNQAIADGNFNLGDTSLSTYAKILTGEEFRDYTEINKKIMDIIQSDTPEGNIENSVNGLSEQISVSKEYIVYSLSTKEFVFQKEEDLGV